MSALDDIHDAFLLPLLERAYDQFYEMLVIIQSLQRRGERGVWSYVGGKTHYSSQKAYKHLQGTEAVHPTFTWIWKLSCQMKHKVFFGCFCKTD
jgi:hypothetical protein